MQDRPFGEAKWPRPKPIAAQSVSSGRLDMNQILQKSATATALSKHATAPTNGPANGRRDADRRRQPPDNRILYLQK